jgi:starch synthase
MKQSVNGMKQDYMAQQSQISEEKHSVTEGINDNSSSSASVDIMNIILVAAECAPWSKTGKNI